MQSRIEYLEIAPGAMKAMYGLDVLKVRFLSAQLESVRLFAREYIGT